MKHVPHPALIGSYNNARGLNEMRAAAKAWQRQIADETEERQKAKLWSLAHIKAVFGRKKPYGNWD